MLINLLMPLYRLIAFVPFISLIFYSYWNVKVYVFINSIIFLYFFLFIISINKKRYLFLPKQYKLFGFVLFISLVSYFLSPVRSIISMEYINFISGFIIFILVLNIEDNFNVSYFYPFIAIIIFVSLYNLWEQKDIVATFKNSNLLAFVIILLSGMFIDMKKYYVAIILFTILIATKSISAMISILIISFYYGWINRKNIDFKNSKFIIFILFFLLFFLICNIEPKSVIDRLRWWKASLDIFIQRPLIGFGYSSFTHILSAFTLPNLLKSVYAHNYFIETLSEHGILFFLAWLYILLNIIKSSKGLYPYILSAALIHSFFDFGLNTVCGWWFFMYVSAYACSKNIVMFKLGNRYSVVNNYLLFVFSFLIVVWIFFSFKYIELENKNNIINKLIAERDFIKAKSLVDDTINKYPDNIDMYIRKAEILTEIYEAERNPYSLKELSDVFEMILKINPYNVKIYDKLERIYENLNDSRISSLSYRKHNYIKYTQ